MSTKYILEEQTPIKETDLLKWAMWFETADRVVEQTAVNNEITVSTIFLGLNHQFGDGPPLLFETLIIGGPNDGDMRRYPTWKEAEIGHGEMMALQPTAMAI